jgi:signal transduction histidine kinase
MTDTAVSAPVRPYQLKPLVPSQAPRSEQPGVQQILAEQERHRLARELHDGAIQEVLAAGLVIDSCLADLPAESPLYAGLDQAKQLTTTATRRLRSLFQDLREGAAFPGEDLAAMLQRLEAPRGTRQFEVSVEVTGAPLPLPPTVRRALFQVASECVFNAALHGGARRAVIRLSYGGGAVVLCVADDGHGKAKTIRKVLRGEVPGTGGGYHTGLFDIAARAEEMGWTLGADRSDLGGIAVRVVAPVVASGDGLGGSDE